MRTALPVLHGADDEWYTPAYPGGDLAARFTLEIHGPGASPRTRIATVERTRSTRTGGAAQDVSGFQEFDCGPFTATHDGEESYLRVRASAWRPGGEDGGGAGVLCPRV